MNKSQEEIQSYFIAWCQAENALSKYRDENRDYYNSIEYLRMLIYCSHKKSNVIFYIAQY